jgi:hypothetical protein
MVLSEETQDRVVFRFHGKHWGMTTLMPGIVLVSTAIGLYFAKHSTPTFLATIVVF